MTKTAILGAGVIGASWTALFLAAGKDVHIYDPSPTVEDDVKAYVETAWPTLIELGLDVDGRRGALKFFASAGDAVKNCQLYNVITGAAENHQQPKHKYGNPRQDKLQTGNAARIDFRIIVHGSNPVCDPPWRVRRCAVSGKKYPDLQSQRDPWPSAPARSQNMLRPSGGVLRGRA